jgi:hypothetical protein
MPTIGVAHDKFWQSAGPAPSVGPDTLPFMGVGRGAVASFVLLNGDSWLSLLLLFIWAIAEAGILNKARTLALRALGGEHGDLLAFLHGEDGMIAKTALEAKTRWVLDSHMAEQKALELGYLKAQQMGCKLSGWHLSFALHYWLGRLEGKW